MSLYSDKKIMSHMLFQHIFPQYHFLHSDMLGYQSEQIGSEDVER